MPGLRYPGRSVSGVSRRPQDLPQTERVEHAAIVIVGTVAVAGTVIPVIVVIVVIVAGTV